MNDLEDMMVAIFNDDDAQLRELIAKSGTGDMCDSSLYTLLHWSAQCGSHKCVKLLCNTGARVDAIDTEGNSPSIIAAAYGYDSILAYLIARGARRLRRPDGYSALHAAAAIGCVACVRRLVSLIPDSINEQDGNGVGRSPLHWACQEGHVDVVEELLSAGADLEIVSDGEFTPLKIAAAEGHVDVVRSLVRAGVDVNRRVQREDGSLSGTALHDAVIWERHDVAKALIASGADLTLPDDKGKTVRDYAADTKNTALIALLTGTHGET